jgi:hypothetical protein
MVERMRDGVGWPESEAGWMASQKGPFSRRAAKSAEITDSYEKVLSWRSLGVSAGKTVFTGSSGFHMEVIPGAFEEGC